LYEAPSVKMQACLPEAGTKI